MPGEKVPPLASVALTALRRARGWTARKLAAEAGISTVKLSLYENERGPSPEKLTAFAEAMGYDGDAPGFVLAGLTQAVDTPEAPRSPLRFCARRPRLWTAGATRACLASCG